MSELVFVYGTLMRGNRNYRWLLQDNPDAEFVGEGWANGLGLYNVTSRYPGIVREEGACTRGEVFGVSQRVLHKMDRLEDEGELYILEKTMVELTNGQTMEAWVYIWNRVPDSATRVSEQNQPWKAKRSGKR